MLGFAYPGQTYPGGYPPFVPVAVPDVDLMPADDPVEALAWAAVGARAPWARVSARRGAWAPVVARAWDPVEGRPSE